MKGPRPKPEQDRFWSKVERSDAGCWRWISSRSNVGYGMFYRNSACPKISAHRMSCEFRFGVIPDGMHVLHRCDTPTCVNPDHLFLGTAKDNAQDRESKARGNHRGQPGESHPMAKLTKDQVLDIRANFALCRVTQRELAERFSVDRTTIGLIVRGRTWLNA